MLTLTHAAPGVAWCARTIIMIIAILTMIRRCGIINPGYSCDSTASLGEPGQGEARGGLQIAIWHGQRSSVVERFLSPLAAIINPHGSDGVAWNEVEMEASQRLGMGMLS